MKTYISATLVLLLAATFQGQGTLIQQWSNFELIKQSDIVVEGTLQKTADNGTLTYLEGNPDITHTFPAIAVDATISVTTILKGIPTNKNIVVRVFKRYGPQPKATIGCEPYFDFSNKAKYLLYLRHDRDGQYIPTSGPWQPWSAIREIDKTEQNTVASL